MNIRNSDQPVTCAKCGRPTGTGFKIQGQNAPICASCLEDYAMQQATGTNVTIDGLHKGAAAAAAADEGAKKD